MKKIVIIDWADSVKASDWTFIEDVDEKPVDCISVGFLLKETDNHITIAQNYGLKPEQVCNLITIPKCSIKNIREIKDKYTWKPSDEQMKVLISEVEGWTKGCPKQKVLESLYNDLKKLKG